MQDEVTQARIEHLRGEIRRCDEAIEQGTADNWWHIDRDRFRQELDSLTEPRHRHQAERETLARMEPVAWMYEREADAHNERCVVYSDVRWPADDPARSVWTERALYALPPAPEAGQ